MWGRHPNLLILDSVSWSTSRDKIVGHGLTLVVLALLSLAFLEACTDTCETDVYVFPVQPGSREWATFRTHGEMVAACQVPEPILRDMSTEGLIETCLSYPLIGDMGAYNSWQQGLDRVAARFNGLQELLRRPDVGTELLARYRQMDPAGIQEKGTSLQRGQYAIEFQHVEMLLAQRGVLSSMTVAERRDLLAECLEKSRSKEPPGYGVVDVAYTAWVMGRILVMDAPGHLGLEERTGSELAYFVEEGSLKAYCLCASIWPVAGVGVQCCTGELPSPGKCTAEAHTCLV